MPIAITYIITYICRVLIIKKRKMKITENFYKDRQKGREIEITEIIEKFADMYFDEDLSIEELKERMENETPEVQKHVLDIVS